MTYFFFYTPNLRDSLGKHEMLSNILDNIIFSQHFCPSIERPHNQNLDTLKSNPCMNPAWTSKSSEEAQLLYMMNRIHLGFKFTLNLKLINIHKYTFCILYVYK